MRDFHRREGVTFRPAPHAQRAIAQVAHAPERAVAFQEDRVTKTAGHLRGGLDQPRHALGRGGVGHGITQLAGGVVAHRHQVAFRRDEGAVGGAGRHGGDSSRDQRRRAAVGRIALPELAAAVLAHAVEGAVGFQVKTEVVARRHRLHTRRDEHRRGGVGRSAQLAVRVAAHRIEIATGGHVQAVVHAGRHRRHAGGDLHGGVLVGRVAIAEFAAGVIAHGPERTIGFDEETVIATRHHGGHVGHARHLPRLPVGSVGQRRRIDAQLALIVAPGPPERAVILGEKQVLPTHGHGLGARHPLQHFHLIAGATIGTEAELTVGAATRNPQVQRLGRGVERAVGVEPREALLSGIDDDLAVGLAHQRRRRRRRHKHAQRRLEGELHAALRAHALKLGIEPRTGGENAIVRENQHRIDPRGKRRLREARIERAVDVEPRETLPRGVAVDGEERAADHQLSRRLFAERIDRVDGRRRKPGVPPAIGAHPPQETRRRGGFPSHHYDPVRACAQQSGDTVVGPMAFIERRPVCPRHRAQIVALGRERAAGVEQGQRRAGDAVDLIERPAHPDFPVGQERQRPHCPIDRRDKTRIDRAVRRKPREVRTGLPAHRGEAAAH